MAKNKFDTHNIESGGTPVAESLADYQSAGSSRSTAFAQDKETNKWWELTFETGTFQLALKNLIDQNAYLQKQITILITAMTEQNSRIDKLVRTLARPSDSETESTEKVIKLRKIPKKKAKREIENLFKKSKTLYFSDIAEKLKLDLELVVKLCSELQKESKIKIKG